MLQHISGKAHRKAGFSAFIFLDGLWCDVGLSQNLRFFNVTIEHLLNSPIPRGFWESRICIDIPQNEKKCWNRDSKIHLKLCQERNRHATTHFPSKVVASLVSAKYVPNSHFTSFGCPTEIRDLGSMEQRKSTPRVLKGPKNPKIRIYGRNHLIVGFMISMEKLTQKNSQEHSFFVEKNSWVQNCQFLLGWSTSEGCDCLRPAWPSKSQNRWFCAKSWWQRRRSLSCENRHITGRVRWMMWT